jgi:hypothetical protein
LDRGFWDALSFEHIRFVSWFLMTMYSHNLCLCCNLHAFSLCFKEIFHFLFQEIFFIFVFRKLIIMFLCISNNSGLYPEHLRNIALWVSRSYESSLKYYIKKQAIKGRVVAQWQSTYIACTKLWSLTQKKILKINKRGRPTSLSSYYVFRLTFCGQQIQWEFHFKSLCSARHCAICL